MENGRMESGEWKMGSERRTMGEGFLFFGDDFLFDKPVLGFNFRMENS